MILGFFQDLVLPAVMDTQKQRIFNLMDNLEILLKLF